MRPRCSSPLGRDAMINETRQVLIDYLAMDLSLAKELRFDVRQQWGPTTQHRNPVSPARVRAPKRATRPV